MTITDWVEHLRCPKCGKTGDTELFEISPFNNGFRRIADGFKVVTVQYGKSIARFAISRWCHEVRPPQLAASFVSVALESAP
jgi:hypothetical protein